MIFVIKMIWNGGLFWFVFCLGDKDVCKIGNRLRIMMNIVLIEVYLLVCIGIVYLLWMFKGVIGVMVVELDEGMFDVIEINVDVGFFVIGLLLLYFDELLVIGEIMYWLYVCYVVVLVEFELFDIICMFM